MATVSRLSAFEKFSFGCGDVGCTVVWNVVSMFLAIYYTDDVGISAAAVAAIMLSVRIFDGLTDLVMGYILDRTNSKMGKARPWILLSAPFMAIFVVLCFSVPDFLAPTMKIVYAFLTYFFLTAVIYTACNLSYCALTSFITDDIQDRATMNAFRFVLTSIGSLVLGYVTPVAVKSLGWLGITTVYGSIAFVLLFLCVFVCKERILPQQRTAEDKVTVRESISVLSHNTYFYFLVSFFVIDFIILGLCSTSGMYLARYVVEDDAFFGHINLACTLPQLVTCFAYPWIMQICRGKWNTIILGYGLYIIGFGMCSALVSVEMCIGSKDYFIMLTGLALKGIGWGMHLIAMFAMIADVVEYGEWKSGRRLEGAAYSASSFGFKIGLGVGSAIVGVALSFVDYDASLIQQPDETLEAIIHINFTIPLILSIVGLGISLLDNLDTIYPTVIQELSVRRAEEAAHFANLKQGS